MALLEDENTFKPALLVVDMQEDFCPPDGSLAVDGGRSIASAINTLLDLPFVLKVATVDWHPKDHVSFSTSHKPPNNRPFQSFVSISNPAHNSEEQRIPIWPVHCVQDTQGAKIIPEIHASKFDTIIEKGKDSGLEMFSGFADVFGNKVASAVSQDLAALLRSRQISHVFTVGLAGDFCVKCSALDAIKEGFTVYVVEDATRSVDHGEHGWVAAKRQLAQAGAIIAQMTGPEVARVEDLRLAVPDDKA